MLHNIKTSPPTEFPLNPADDDASYDLASRSIEQDSVRDAASFFETHFDDPSYIALSQQIDFKLLKERIFSAFGRKHSNAAKLLWSIAYWFLPDRRGSSRLKVFKGNRWVVAKSVHHFRDDTGIPNRTIERNLKWLRSLGLIDWKKDFFNHTGNPNTKRGCIRHFYLQYAAIAELYFIGDGSPDRAQMAILKRTNGNPDRAQMAILTKTNGNPPYNSRSYLTVEKGSMPDNNTLASPSASRSGVVDASLGRVNISCVMRCANQLAQQLEPSVKSAYAQFKAELPSELCSSSVVERAARDSESDLNSLSYSVRHAKELLSAAQREALQRHATAQLSTRIPFRPARSVEFTADWQPPISLNEKERQVAVFAAVWKAGYAARKGDTDLSRKTIIDAISMIDKCARRWPDKNPVERAARFLFMDEIAFKTAYASGYDPMWASRNKSHFIGDASRNFDKIISESKNIK